MGTRQVTLRTLDPRRSSSMASRPTSPVAQATPAPVATPHLELRIAQRTRQQLAGREILREELLVERCRPDGRLLSLETERRAPDGTFTRRRVWQEGGALKSADAPAMGITASAPKETKTRAPVMGRCALWIAFLERHGQAGGDPASTAASGSASPAPASPAPDPEGRHLLVADEVSGEPKPGLLLRLPDAEWAPQPPLPSGSAARSSVTPSSAATSRGRYRFADAKSPAIHTDYLLGPSGVPDTIRVNGVGVPLILVLTTRAHAEAALASQARSLDESHLTLDVGARLPEPTTLVAMRWAISLAEPLTADLARSLDEGQQRRLGRNQADNTTGGASGNTPGAPGDLDSLTIEVRRADIAAPAIAALPYPLPIDRVPETARAYLHPRLSPTFGPDDPARRALAAELTGITTSLAAALRLTQWAARAADPDRAASLGAGSAALALSAPERLVAALRAARLPARLAYGLLYVGSMAVEHRWAEVHLGAWLPLDPEVGGLAGASHLRFVFSPPGPAPTPDPAAPSRHPSADDPLTRDPAAAWSTLRRTALRTPGFKLRLLEAQLPSGFRFTPGGPLNTQVTANALTHRAWNFVLRRPLAPATRFALPGAADDFEAQVVGTRADLRLTLRLWAASAEGLDARAFIAKGYRLRRIGENDFLVKDRGDRTAPTKPSSESGSPSAPGSTPSPRPAAGSSAVHRAYLQISCAEGPWSARLVRFTLDARGVPATDIAELEQKSLGTFHMIGRTAGASSCVRPTATKGATPAPAEPAAPTTPAAPPTPAAPMDAPEPATPAPSDPAPMPAPERATPAPSDPRPTSPPEPMSAPTPPSR